MQALTDTKIPKKYVGQRVLTTLFSNTNLGQYYDSVTKTYAPTWRDTTPALTYNEYPINVYSGAYSDNQRFQGSTSFFSLPADENWDTGNSILQSSTATNYIECQVNGEVQVVYGFHDVSYGTGKVYIDNVVVAASHNWGQAETSTVIATMESTEGWGTGSTNDTANVKVGTSSRRITLAAGNDSITSTLIFNRHTAQTFSSNNPVNINTTAHGLLNGDRVAIVSSTATGSLANGNYTITKVDADNFTVPFNGSGAGGTCTWSQIKDYSAVSNDAYIKMWVYIIAVEATRLCALVIDSTDSVAGSFTNFATANWSSRFVTGWNELTIRKGDFLISGTMNWGNVYKIFLRHKSTRNGGGYASFDHLRWVTPDVLYTATGLTPGDHTVKIECTSGIVNLAYIASTASRRSLEYHRDSRLMGVPALASLYAMTGDTAWADKAAGGMDYYATYNQLGIRGDINRSRRGTLGQGGMEEAYFVSSSNYILPGDPTTTSGGFDGVFMGLTYLVLEKSGYATSTQLSNWRAMLKRLGAYAERRGYTSSQYFNTGNASILWATTFYLIYLCTGEKKWAKYADNSANAYRTLTPGTPLLHYFVGNYDDRVQSTLASANRGYLEEDGAYTTLGSSMTASGTTITFTSGGTAAIGLATSDVNALIQVDSEIIKLTSFVSGQTWNVQRAQLHSTAAVHANAARVVRGLDFGYSRVQAPTLYLYGILTNDRTFINLGKHVYNAAKDRINITTGAMDISGGSRNLAVIEGYWGGGFGINAMAHAANSPYPDDGTFTTMLAGWENLVNTYGFAPGDTVANTAANTVLSFPTVAFALGYVNCLIYLGYITPRGVRLEDKQII